jgi:hypothetical protein
LSDLLPSCGSTRPFSNFTSEQLKFSEVLQPYAFSEICRVDNEAKSFVYYTTSETAYKILTKNEIWLRKTSLMNDFREMVYGYDLLAKSVKQNKDRLMKILNTIAPNLFEDIIEQFDNWWPETYSNTYIACISEHNPTSSFLDEDQNGRLSMWRAYGNKSGVAFVMNNGPFLRPSSALNAFTTPVAYLDERLFEAKFTQWMAGLESNLDVFRGTSREFLIENFHRVFIFVIVGTKHPGFAEEREWRIIYTPVFGLPTKLKKEVVLIGGIPQLVYKLPLENVPDKGLFGVSVPELIQKIIVGPTQHPFEIQSALVEVLTACGVPSPYERVVVSNIPLR